MMGTFEIFLILVLLPVVMIFELTPTFGTIPITTVGISFFIWYMIVGALEGVGVGLIVLLLVILFIAILLLLANLTPGANTTFALMILPVVWITWGVARAISGQWPDYFFGTTYMASVLPTTVLPSAILTPILGPTIGFILTIPAFYTATAGFPWSFSPTFTTLASIIFLSSLVPIVGPTTAIIPYLTMWLIAIIAGVLGFFGTAVAGLIVVPIGLDTGGTIVFVTALIVGFIFNYALTALRVWSTTSTVIVNTTTTIATVIAGLVSTFAVITTSLSTLLSGSSTTLISLTLSTVVPPILTTLIAILIPFLATTFLPTTFLPTTLIPLLFFVSVFLPSTYFPTTFIPTTFVPTTLIPAIMVSPTTLPITSTIAVIVGSFLSTVAAIGGSTSSIVSTISSTTGIVLSITIIILLLITSFLGINTFTTTLPFAYTFIVATLGLVSEAGATLLFSSSPTITSLVSAVISSAPPITSMLATLVSSTPTTVGTLTLSTTIISVIIFAFLNSAGQGTSISYAATPNNTLYRWGT